MCAMHVAAADIMIKDPALADQGRSKIDFAATRMPVLETIRQDFAARRPLDGLRIAGCLHITTETANLCRTLVAGGAEVSVCASNPLSTKDDVAAAIHRDFGAAVYAIHGCDRDTFYRQVEGALSHAPQVIVDDGADLTATIHRERTDLLEGIIGGTEVTSTGVHRMRSMERDGTLGYPVVPLNDALTKHLFDNRYGTGQNTVDGILRAAHVLFAGSVLVVAGYGWCGRGIATRASGMGARVIVVEVDPIKALEAVLDGYDVMPMGEAARHGDIFVTATGNRDVITIDHLMIMKTGAIVCNSGHFDIEIDVAGLKAQATAARPVRPDAVEYTLPSGSTVILLADGRLVGQSAAEASPPDVMDLSFSTQALLIEYLAANAARLTPAVHPVPRSIEDQVAEQKLRSMGHLIEGLSEAQHAYLNSWQTGT
ncbi:adenosylhomocysteinase [Microlunatus soli]|uniref:Adenosylhomocysteinase n=1 Tax=Microlunatus soli TaxID=630515 RepID=A0A1H1SS66_9ACTN|nr:adenosylhomocysteinase [Microlunatus soli]SDS50703.1 adenosylhomocysteinase [Microlunatus soli]